MSDSYTIEDIELSQEEQEEIYNAGIPHILTPKIEKCRIHPQEEFEQLKKEIASQMGVEKFDEALKIKDWSKVNRELKDKYVKYVALCLDETMKNLQ